MPTPAQNIEAAAKQAIEHIAVKLAAFCVRLAGIDGVPESVTTEGNRLAHEFKDVERKMKSAAASIQQE